MENIAHEVRDLFQQYLHQNSPIEISQMLEEYDVAFNQHREQTFFQTFYPTLYAPFEPVVQVDHASSRDAPQRSEQNLNLQNALRIDRPKSNQQRIKSSARNRSSGTAEFLFNGDIFYEDAGRAALPCTLRVLRGASKIPEPQAPSVLARTAYRFEEIIDPTLRLQATFRRYFQRCRYERLEKAARLIQGFFKSTMLNRGFREHFINVTEQVMRNEKQGALLFAELSIQMRQRISRCSSFLKDIFDFNPTRNQFFFPFEINNPLELYWSATYEEEIIRNLNIDRNNPEPVKIDVLKDWKPQIERDAMLDLIIILSQPPDPYLSGYRSSQVWATLSVFSLLASELVSSLVVVAEADSSATYALNLLEVNKPYLIVDAKSGLQHDGLDLSAIDTIQLFNLNSKAQQTVKQFYNQLFIQRKEQNNKVSYSRVVMLTSAHYCYELRNQAVECNRFAELVRAPIIFAYDHIVMERQQMELMAIMTGSSDYYREIEAADLDKSTAVLVRNTFLPNICDLSHAGYENYYLRVVQEPKTQEPAQRSISKQRILTVSGLHSRLNSKRTGGRHRDSPPDEEIRIEIHDGGIIDEEQAANSGSNDIENDAIVDLVPFLPIKQVDVFSDHQAEILEDYIVQQLERESKSDHSSRDYRMLAIDMSKMNYKVMLQTITTKTEEILVKGETETKIVEFTNITEFKRDIPDVEERIVKEEIEKKVDRRAVTTATLVFFVDASHSEAIVSFVISAEDIIERKYKLPFRSHGWVFPARKSVYAQMKQSAIPIINYLVSEHINGYATLSFIVGPKVEPYEVHFGLNQLILQVFMLQRLVGLRVDEEDGSLRPYCDLFETPRNIPEYTAIAIDLCHELLGRVNKHRLRLLLHKYGYDTVKREGFVYDIADDLFVLAVGQDSISKKADRLRKLLDGILRLIHQEFPEAPTSILSGADRKGMESRDVELSSNFLGVVKGLDALKAE